RRLLVTARAVQESQSVPAVEAVEGVAVALGWLAPEADDLTVPQLPFVSLSHASRHRVLPARGVRVVLADLLPENLVDLGVGRSGAHHYGLARSEEHTSELQSRENLVCRLLL